MSKLNVEGLTGFLRGKRYSFEDRSVVFGASDACDVRFDPVWDKTVSAQHATIRFEKGGWILEDQSQQGTFIAGRRIVREPLAGDCTMELGKGGPKIKLSVAAPSAATAAPSGVARGAGVSGNFSLSFRWGAIAVGAVALLATAYGVNAWLRSRAPGEHVDEPGSASVTLATASEPARTTGGVTAGSNAADTPAPQSPSAVGEMPSWELVVDMGEEIFPSFVIASATMKESPFDKLNKASGRLGDLRSAIGVKITSPGPGSKIHVEIKDNEYMHASSVDAVLPEGGKVYRVYPTINYRFDALTRVRQTIPLTVTAEVTFNGGLHNQTAKTVRVASINECPFALSLDETHEINMDWMFAAYVNENHPIADELRKEAIRSGIIKDFVGYQRGEAGVYQQVFAIWNALQHRGVSYSSITSTPGANPTMACQSVRFIDQSVNNSQANCVDGSVLFASILRQIHIEPVLVFPPGHCFVGFVVDPKTKKIDYLETTALGARNAKPSRTGPSPQRKSAKLEAMGAMEQTAPIDGFMKAASDFAPPTAESLQLFSAAVNMARDEVRQGDPGIVWISTARAMGILPIGYSPP